jgi:serine/tyrosine/threonine adenylyltransferase
MRAKLGLMRVEEGDDRLIGELLTLMIKARADYTLSFRHLAEPEHWFTLFNPVRDEALEWFNRYRARRDGDPKAMNRINPKYTLRNWVAETAIRAVEDKGDTGPLDRILRLVQSPYDEHPSDEALSLPPAPEYCELSVSCSS